MSEYFNWEIYLNSAKLIIFFVLKIREVILNNYYWLSYLHFNYYWTKWNFLKSFEFCWTGILEKIVITSCYVILPSRSKSIISKINLTTVLKSLE